MSEVGLESPAEVVKLLSLAEKAKRLGIDPEGKDDQQLTQDIIALREEQPDYVRACEYMTGMLPDDPRLLPKLAEDQLIIRQKYGLPNVSIFINDPAEYERIIREACKKYGFTISTKSECADYFTLHKAMAVTLPPDLNKIHVDIKK